MVRSQSAAEPVTPEMVAALLRESGIDVSGGVSLRRIGIGQSNLTSLMTDEAGRAWVLRQPPPGEGGTAHDMAREVLFLKAMRNTGVPVPQVVADRADANGRLYYVMTEMPGVVLESEADAEGLDPDTRRALGEDVIDVLARLHTLEPASVGLGHLSSTTPYVRRQIRRAAQMWDRVGTQSPLDPLWREVCDGLDRSVPPEPPSAIVHGDYRLSNLLVRNGAVSAVLDWELAAVGDPLVDLAWLLDDWRAPDEPAIAMPSPTRAGGFPDRGALIERYAAATGIEARYLDGLGFYRALTTWRAASLLQGVVDRRRSGRFEDHSGITVESIENSVAALLEQSQIHLRSSAA